MNRIRPYYYLTKPGIIYGNDFNLVAGFLLGLDHHFYFDDLWRLIVTLVGTSMIIGAGCVYNNYMDRGIDKKMDRTKKRASVTGQISIRDGMIYASVLCVVGFALLLKFINVTTAIVGLIGIVDYVVLYGYTKRKGAYGTLIGSISGATPPLAGYTAVTGHIDAGGLLLFLIVTFWQMPHFYSIAMYRIKDYARAGIPVLPIKRGNKTTKLYIFVYICWFIIASSLLYLDGYVGAFYLVVMTLLGFWWLWAAAQGFRSGVEDDKWAKSMFLKSLVIIAAFSLTVSLGALL